MTKANELLPPQREGSRCKPLVYVTLGHFPAAWEDRDGSSRYRTTKMPDCR